MARGKRKRDNSVEGGQGPDLERQAVEPANGATAEHAPAAEGSQETAGKRRYLLDKLSRLTKRPDRRSEAVALLDALWPPAVAVHQGERCLWLLRRFPEQAERELSCGPPLCDAALAFVSEAVLSLTDDQLALLAAAPLMPPAWAAEAQAARTASRLLANGEDAAAAEQLRGIGLSSPLRRVRLFLRGLAAYYQRDDAQAVRALQAIPEVSPLHHATARLLASCGVASADALPLDQSALNAVAAAVGQRRPGAAVSEAARCRTALCAVAEEELARDLASALLQLGVAAGTAVGRLRRALPLLDDPFRRAHLTALAVQGAGAPGRHAGELERCWASLEKHLARGSGDFSDAQRAIARAALLARQGEEMNRRVGEERDRLYDPPWADDYDDDWYSDDDYDDVARLLERTVALDPEEPSHWQALAKAYEQAQNAQAHNSTIERMAKALPDSALAMTTAALAAAERGAWDKALRYARRASELEPLARTGHDLEASLLVGKARKQAARNTNAAAKCYEAAMAVPHRTRRSQMKTAAEAAAFHCTHDAPHKADELRLHTLAADPRPWLWGVNVLLGAEHVSSHHGQRAGGRRPRRGSSAAGSPPSSLEPASAPAAGELAAVLELVEAAHDSQRRIPRPLRDYAVRAIAAGVTGITDGELLAKCLQMACDHPDVALAAAEQGCRVEPSSPVFMAARYNYGVDAGRPSDYFARADAELSEAIDSLRQRMGGRASGPELTPSALLERFGFESPWAHLARVRERVRRYLGRSGNASRPRKGRNGRKGRRHDPRQEEIPF